MVKWDGIRPCWQGGGWVGKGFLINNTALSIEN